MATTSITDHDSRVQLLKTYRTQFASAPAVALSVLAGSPFENLKTRMQSRHFANALECARYTLRTEGYRGFWAGSVPPLFYLTFTRVSGFSFYQKAKYAINDALERTTGHSPLTEVNTPAKNATQTSVLMSGASITDGAGSFKTKNAGRVNTFQAITQIVQRYGILGLYTGFHLHLLRETIGSGLYFGVYESTKQIMTTYSGAEKANSKGAVLVAGGLCGVGAWLFTYPLDTMKTRAQSVLIGNPTKAAQSCVAAAAKSSKFKGVEMMILRSCIQNMIQMSAFEYFKTKINGLK
ncbi:putative mitochondrial carrier protein [Phaeomoniella chlamydospora]|uniref:Putative mitochondrial carrier protein n=1 Tax=Phaeomoniella chlamydospora TaxID=158046 RepID=A0A0G2ENH7_PHACM|nr:putative mitochondrial carrier protein [Phaeomoniella chlamydospora]